MFFVAFVRNVKTSSGTTHTLSSKQVKMLFFLYSPLILERKFPRALVVFIFLVGTRSKTLAIARSLVGISAPSGARRSLSARSRRVRPNGTPLAGSAAAAAAVAAPAAAGPRGGTVPGTGGHRLGSYGATGRAQHRQRGPCGECGLLTQPGTWR